MIRMSLAVVLVTVLIAASPVSAQTTDCKGMMAKADLMTTSMTDKTKQVAAMKEMDMAKDLMAQADEKGCMMHMQNAMGMMK